MAPQKQADVPQLWALPLDPTKRVIHMGDISEIGRIVVVHSQTQSLPAHVSICRWSANFLSFNEILATLNRQGPQILVQAVPREVFATGSRRRRRRSNARLLRSAHVSRLELGVTRLRWPTRSLASSREIAAWAAATSRFREPLNHIATNDRKENPREQYPLDYVPVRRSASYSTKVAHSLAEQLASLEPGASIAVRDLAREPLPHIDVVSHGA